MPDRSHLSIGEVLSLLREEFPDVTISKIRFLESQGLVDPERTPSGYRKFYEHDVERLRWILRQQRENFLPLKVIRGRLSEGAQQVLTEPGSETGPLAGTGSQAESPLVPSTPREAPAGGSEEASSGNPLPAAAGEEHTPAAAGRPGSAEVSQTAGDPASGSNPIPRAGERPAGEPPAGGAPGESGGGRAPDPAGAGPQSRLVPPLTPAGTQPGPENHKQAPTPGGRGSPGRAAPVPGAVTATGAAPVEGNGSGHEEQVEEAARLDTAAVRRAEITRQTERAREEAARSAGRAQGTGSDVDTPREPAGAAPAEAANPGGAGQAPARGGPVDEGHRSGRGEGAGSRRQAGPMGRRRLDEPGEETYTLDELAAASGLPPAAVAGLEQFGLIAPTTAAGVAYYDGNALDVAKAAAGFARYGVEARHLRAWRNAADREASLFEQVVMPLLKQRNPQSRGQAVITLEELSAAAADLHAALLQRALRSLR